LATILQAELKEVGVNLEIELGNPGDANNRWYEGAFDAFVVAVELRGDPSFFAQQNILGQFNPGGATPEMAKAASDALMIPLDDPQREKAFQDLSHLMEEQPVHLPVVQLPVVTIARAGVVGVEDQTFTNFGSMTDVRPLGATEAG